MSTCFEVYPRSLKGVTHGAVIGLGTQILHEQLRRNAIDESGLALEWRYRPDHGPACLRPPEAPFVWGIEEGYTFVSIKGSAGGTDIRIFDEVDPIDAHDTDTWIDFFPAATHDIPDFETLLTYFDIGWHWSLRRSAGQPALVNIMYGCLAAALATLSDGAICSSDGAAPGLLPLQRAEEFLTWWFLPAQVSDLDTADWYQRCLDMIRRGEGRD